MNDFESPGVAAELAEALHTRQVPGQGGASRVLGVNGDESATEASAVETELGTT